MLLLRKPSLLHQGRKHLQSLFRQGPHIEIRHTGRIIKHRFKPGISHYLKPGCFGNILVFCKLICTVLVCFRDSHMPVAVHGDTVIQKESLEAGTEGRHCRDHRSRQNNTDDGHDRPDTVCPHRLCRNSGENIHRLITSSFTIRPSSSAMIRSACRAIFSSCVITITV